MRIRRSVLILASTALLSLPGLAGADPVTLSSGFWAINEEGPRFRFVGPGFVLDGTGVVPGPNAWGFALRICPVCSPGEEYGFGGESDGEVFLGAGSVTSGSNTLESARLSGHLKFVAPTIVLPPGGDSVLHYRLPFVLTGFVRAVDNDHRGFEILTRFQGVGFVSARFLPTSDGRWENSEGGILTYEISGATPTPEPATVLLLGPGIAALAAARRRRRANHEPSRR